MSMLPDFKRRRREAVDERDIGLQRNVNKLMELYNAGKKNDFSVISIPSAPNLRQPRIVQAFWKKIQKDEKAFLVYGKTYMGVLPLKKITKDPQKFDYFDIGKQILAEIHFVRTSPKSIAQEICTMFSKSSNASPIDTKFIVEVSEISCFKYIHSMHFLEFRLIRKEIEKLVGHIEVYDTFWYNMYHPDLEYESAPITRLRLTIVNDSDLDSDDSDDSSECQDAQ